MENGAISDRQITASSEWDRNHAAIQGRLHLRAGMGKKGSWSALTKDINQWLQVDLGIQHSKVTRVATQGRNDKEQWVTKYKLQYGKDTANMQNYTEQGRNTGKVKLV